MAEPERTTSFAKSVEGLHKEESALDRARSLRDQFTHAQEQNNEKQKPREAEKPQGETEKSGSAWSRKMRRSFARRRTAPCARWPTGRRRSPSCRRNAPTSAQKLQQAQQMRDAFKERQQKSPDHGHDREH